jgi:predicted dehydrogenase
VSDTHSWRVAVVGFSHMHAGDQVRQALETPAIELVGLFDDDLARMTPVVNDFGLDPSIVFSSLDALIAESAPDIVVICSTTREHTDLVERLAPHGIHVMLEKPFAVSLAEADRMIAAARAGGATLSVNWPLAWYPAHRTAQRLLAEGTIGEVREIHYYDGNRGPLKHVHDKKAMDVVDADKDSAWWYSAADGGGSLLDYLGYGATLSTWMRDGQLPTSILAKTFVPAGMEVDEQSVVIASYPQGLSVLQTRWGTFTDPWTMQPYPRCGFVIVGERGTILSEDYAPTVMIQTADRPVPTAVPVDTLAPEFTSGLGYLVARLTRGEPIEGPSSWQISRAGQVIVDAAIRSAAIGRDVELEN